LIHCMSTHLRIIYETDRRLLYGKHWCKIDFAA
jgi:hypothetical protein